MHKFAALMPLALLASCATYGGDRASQSEEESRAVSFADVDKVGEPQSCVQISRIRETNVIGDRVIDFELTGGRTFRNVLPNRCPGLGFEESFSYRTSINQLCSSEIIRVLDHTAGRLDTRAACGLGRFQEIKPRES